MITLSREIAISSILSYKQIEPLQKFVEVAREDNRKLAYALDLALQRNSDLQNRCNELEKDLQNKELREKQLILNQ